MAKGLTISSLVVAILLFVVFAIDLILGIPFGRPSLWMDVAFVLCGLGLAYISWMTLKELR